MRPLNEELTALRAEKDAARDPAATATMHRATEQLRASGALAHVKTVGENAPIFARPNLEGETVRLRTLLRSGPVVLSFFRGRW